MVRNPGRKRRQRVDQVMRFQDPAKRLFPKGNMPSYPINKLIDLIKKMINLSMKLPGHLKKQSDHRGTLNLSPFDKALKTISSQSSNKGRAGGWGDVKSHGNGTNLM